LQPLNASAVRPPANTPSTNGASSTTVNTAVNLAAGEPVTAESLGWQLRAALPPLRLHSVSLYDDEANILWLSEGALGPDEHSLVLEAIETLGTNSSLSVHENGLEDGRIAIFLPVRAPQGDLVGVAMVLADVKSVTDGVVERMVTPQVRTVMQKVAVLVRTTNARSGQSAVPVLELAKDPAPVTQVVKPAVSKPPADAVKTDPARPSTEGVILSAQAVSDILEFELTPDLPPVEGPRAGAATATLDAKAAGIAAEPKAPITEPKGAAIEPRVAAVEPKVAINSPGATSTSRVLTMPEGATLFLEVHPFNKLRAGGRSRRFEVQARASRAPAALDSIALHRLLSWLHTNRSAWNSQPTSFTLNLSITTLEDERFPQFLASTLKSHAIAPESLGFEIAEPLCLQRRAQVERFMSVCDKIGCFIVIDDFSFDSAAVSLLRSKALRLVKIDPKLTSVALKDKLAQAMVVAIAQAVKVLGIHCSAKRVDSQAALQWLTAIGCDFAQGPVLAPSQPLEALAGRSG